MDRKQFEIIVVDDASTDETPEIIRSYAEEIRPVILAENMGLADARNRGIKIARGRYIVFLDADDYLDENLLLVESLFLNANPEWGGVSCDYFEVDDQERHIARVDGSEHPIACGLMMRMDALVDIGLYDPNFRMREEEDLRHRFLKKYSIKHLEIPLYRYRHHEHNMTKNVAAMAESERQLKEKHGDL